MGNNYRDETYLQHWFKGTNMESSSWEYFPNLFKGKNKNVTKAVLKTHSLTSSFFFFFGNGSKKIMCIFCLTGLELRKSGLQVQPLILNRCYCIGGFQFFCFETGEKIFILYPALLNCSPYKL